MQECKNVHKFTEFTKYRINFLKSQIKLKIMVKIVSNMYFYNFNITWCNTCIRNVILLKFFSLTKTTGKNVGEVDEHF